MKIIFLILVVLLCDASSEGHNEKSIHFKIHVPEIIRHHIHTKTVFIHVHEMNPHGDGKYNKENHAEDWTSYNSYNYDNNNGLEENHASAYNRKKQKNTITPYNDYLPIREYDYEYLISPYTYNPLNHLLTNEPPVYNESPVSPFDSSMNPEDIDEHMPTDDIKTHQPLSQYEIHESVDEHIPSNDINYQKVLEEGYRQGMKTESGHVIHKNLKDFYDKENEEENYSNDAFEEENYNKYNNHDYYEKYDKEIGLEQRVGKKRADRRYITSKMIIR